VIDLEFYKKHYVNIASTEELYNYFLSTIVESNKTWEYFVDWEKVRRNVRKIERALNLLNSVIGKSNIKDELRDLIREYPQVINAIPILVAIRDCDISIIDISKNELKESRFSFFNTEELSLDNEKIEKILEFCEKVGIINLLSGEVKNLVDYVFGIEVGMDTNARKNRSGKILEFFLDKYFMEIIHKNDDLAFISQCNVEKINKELNLNITLHKRMNKKFDFVFYNSNSNIIFFVESNFYNVSGSKPDAISGGDFEVLALSVKESVRNSKFVWITDGKGWRDSKHLLKDVFTKESFIDYVFNIKMIRDGLLEKLLLSK